MRWHILEKEICSATRESCVFCRAGQALVEPDSVLGTDGRIFFRAYPGFKQYCVADAGPCVWNSLPVAICNPSLSYTTMLSRLLKTHLFI